MLHQIPGALRPNHGQIRQLLLRGGVEIDDPVLMMGLAMCAGLLLPRVTVLVVGHVRLLPPSETDHGAKQHNVGWRREDHENVQGIPGNNVGDGFVWAGWRAS